MSTDTGLDMDMHTALQWPGRVRIRIHIEHLQGPAEECRLTLNRSAVPRVVAVGLDPKPAPGAGGRHLQWQELPGRTLRQRSLAAVATWLFDSVKMAPRICGLPMYRAVSLTMAAEGHELRATQVQVLADGDGSSRALLRHRRAHADPWAERAVVLERWDADPLRAVLRLAMGLREAGPRVPMRGGLSRAGTGAPATRPVETLQFVG